MLTNGLQYTNKRTPVYLQTDSSILTTRSSILAKLKRYTSMLIKGVHNYRAQDVPKTLQDTRIRPKTRPKYQYFRSLDIQNSILSVQQSIFPLLGHPKINIFGPKLNIFAPWTSKTPNFRSKFNIFGPWASTHEYFQPSTSLIPSRSHRTFF